MFVSEKASAYGGFVFGVLGLIGVGAIGSMVMNHRTAAFGVGKALDRDLAENVERLESLHNQVDALNDRVRDDLTPRKACEAQLGVLNGEAGRQQILLNDLRNQRDGLSSELSAAQAEARSYRDRYRAQVRRQALGEKIPDLITRNGKHFQNAEITDVSAAGMTIRHEGGMVRLAPSELDAKWTERFQWNPEELTSVSAPPGSAPAQVPSSIAASSAKDAGEGPIKTGGTYGTKVSKEALEDLRHDVRSLSKVVDGLQVQLDGARSQADNGHSRSVPGTIQTWGQRISALEKDLAKASGRLAIARQKLAEVSPHDFVLSLSNP